MSFGPEDAHRFVGALQGKSTTFLVEDRKSNLALARAIMAALAMANKSCTVLDLDATYSSNLQSIFNGLPRSFGQGTRLVVPDADASPQEEIPKAAAAPSDVIMMDSLNTLYHMLASVDGGSTGRALAFLTAGLSYIARTEGKLAIFTMYRREGLSRARSIANLSDMTASVEAGATSVRITGDRGSTLYPNPLIIAISIPAKTETATKSNESPR